MQKNYEVKTIRVVYECDACGDAELEQIAGDLYICPNCGIKKRLGKKYPYEYKKLIEVK